MALFDRMRTLMQYQPVAPSRRTRLVTPWSEGQALGTITADIFGGEYTPVTREQAMRVPAVAKARAIITGTLAKQPLREYENGEPVVDQAPWLQGTDTDTPVWHRMAWTLDDLYFYGWSLWAREDLDGTMRAAMRVPYEQWRFVDDAIEVKVEDEWFPARADEVVLFPGPQEGILELAGDTIRGARAIERTILDRARTPFSAIDIKQTDGTFLEDDEIEDLIDGYVSSRRNIDGSAIGYVPPGIDLEYHNEETSMLIEARNALRLDVAAFSNLPGMILDASLSTATLTYSTQEGKRNELLDYSLGFWADPIASRLSQDDIVAPGRYVRFDLTEFVALVNSPHGPVTED